MRFLLRFISLFFLASAVIIGVIDSIQSVAGEAVVLTPVDSVLAMLNPAFADSVQAYLASHLSAETSGAITTLVLDKPAVSLFLVISLVFWLIAYKREPAGRFAA